MHKRHNIKPLLVFDYLTGFIYNTKSKVSFPFKLGIKDI